jgi:hypothetical protein
MSHSALFEVRVCSPLCFIDFDCLTIFETVTKAVNTFVSADLSAFYSSVVKLRLYCEASDSITRRSAQTVLFEVLISVLCSHSFQINKIIYRFCPDAANLDACIGTHH